MTARIAIPLSLVIYIGIFFLGAFHFQSGAVKNEADYIASLSKLSTIQARNFRKHPGYEVWKILEAKASGLTKFERLQVTNLIIRYSRIYGHDPHLLLAVMEIESNFRRRAVSNKGAVGLMQIRPFVARGLAREMNMNPEKAARQLVDLETNVKIGSYYLAKMVKRFGNITLALEAYNLGPTRLRDHLRNGVELKKRYTKKVLRSRENIAKMAKNLA